MPVSVTISDAGVVETPGSGGLTIESTITLEGRVVMAQLPATTVQTQNTSSGSIVAPGVYTISGSQALPVISSRMPAASSFPGGLFVFRCASNDAHFLTGSGESNGVKVFKGGFNISGSEGSKLALSPAVGASVALLSDGVNYLVTAHSGTLTFSTPVA